MNFVDLKLTINVDFGIMTEDQYKEFVAFFSKRFGAEEIINNKALIECLDLDARPFAVTRIKSPIFNGNKEISLAEIDTIC